MVVKVAVYLQDCTIFKFGIWVLEEKGGEGLFPFLNKRNFKNFIKSIKRVFEILYDNLSCNSFYLFF